jgi:hypothetical protein
MEWKYLNGCLILFAGATSPAGAHTLGTLLEMEVMQHIELANLKYRMFLSAIISQ